MIRIFIALICTLAMTPSFAQRNIDIIHYRYHITLNDQNDTINGVAEISMRFLAPSNMIELDMTGRGNDGRGMIASKVTGPNTRGFEKEAEKLKIALLKEARTGDTATYIITYHGKPKDGLIISKNKYGHRTFFADNWPNRGHNWIPCVDDPADKASVEFIVTAPLHYQVVANGIQLEETNLDNKQKRTHWKEDVPISTKVMVIGAAAFAVQLAGNINGCIPVYSWVYPEDRDKGFFDYAQAAEILPYFINHVGPYPYKKLANVQSKTTFGGLENANTIFYSESSVTGTRKSETLLAHEIAHQWFGNMATEKTFAHLWLSEGFATYMTILYMENKYGQDTALAMLKQDRQEVIAYSRETNQSVVDNNPDYMALLNVNSYQKGGWVLHMLRRQLGDSIFWKGIRKYYSSFAGKTADTDDLRKVFEEVSGKNMGKFFQQWLYSGGQPELDIEWKYDATKKEVSVTIRQAKGLFEFPLDVGFKPAIGKISVSRVNVSQALTTITYPMKEKPVMVIADPGVSLLFHASVKEKK